MRPLPAARGRQLADAINFIHHTLAAMRHFALIAAGGHGARFGTPMPKQYLPLLGKATLRHSIERLGSALPLAGMFVVIAEDDRWYDAEVGALAGVTVLRCGGADRGASIRNALAAMAGVDDDDWILVHDGARPCIDRAALQRLVREIADDPVGGLLGHPVTGTLKRADATGRITATVSRAGIWEAQTPQMFRYGLLSRAHSRGAGDPPTDDAQAVEALGLQPRLVLGSATNIKITYADDLALAAAILAAEAAPA